MPNALSRRTNRVAVNRGEKMGLALWIAIFPCRPPIKPPNPEIDASRSPSDSRAGHPAYGQQGHIVGLLGTADKAPDVIDYRRNDALRIDDRRLPQRCGQPLRRIERVVGVLGFGDPVGVKKQDLAWLDPAVIDRIAEVIDRAERGTALGDELPQAALATEDERRVVPGAGKIDLSRTEVENPGERSHEDAALALQLRTRRRRLPVGLRANEVGRRRKCQHGVANDLLG